MNPELFLTVAGQLSTAVCLLTTEGVVLAANDSAKAVFNNNSVVGTFRLQDLVWERPAKVNDLLKRWSAHNTPALGVLNITGDDETLIRCNCMGRAIAADSPSLPPLILLELQLDKDNHGIVVALNEKTVEARQASQQRQSVERAFKLSENSLRLLVEAVKDCSIIMLDPQGHVVSWNAGAQRIKGYRAEEIIGQSFKRFYSEEDLARGLPETLLATARSQGAVECEGWRVRKDGSQFWAVAETTAIYDEKSELIGFAKVTRDLTAQRQAEEEVRASEERFRTIVEAAPNGFLMVNMNGDIELMNSQVEQIFGYSRDELIGCNVDCLVAPEYREGHQKNRKNYNTKPSVRTMGAGRELYGMHKNGKLVPIEIGLNPLITGGSCHILASVIDVSEWKRTETALRASEQRLNEAQRLAHIGSWELDVETSEMSWSNEVFNILEVDRDLDAPTYAAFVASVYPEDRDNLVNAFQSAVNDLDSYELVHRLQMQDGRIKYVRERGEAFQEKGKSLRAFGTILDITALKMAEEELYTLNRELEQRVEQRTVELRTANQQLRQSLDELSNAQMRLVQSEKMAALGGLVAGVAHEINTPAGVGITAASYLSEKIAYCRELYDSGKLKRSNFESFLQVAYESSNIIVSNLQRAADLIRSFKQVAVDQSNDEQRHFDLKQYIEEVLVSLRPKLKGTRHEVVFNCPEEVYITSYPGAFSQIITNFIINSLVHGFEGTQGGKMTIDVDVNSSALMLRYRDNGKGIPEDYLMKIFDPFFTTKRGQGGSGLGMHIVHNLVTQLLNGKIECVSTVGDGVMFEIWIPMHECEEAEEETRRAS